MNLQQPIDIALIGTGFRSRTAYRLLLPALRAREARLVAVCDPVRESADSFAASVGLPAFYSIRDLVAEWPIEAALVCTPPELFHSISSYLSQQGVHHLGKASFCASLTQAHSMLIPIQRRPSPTPCPPRRTARSPIGCIRKRAFTLTFSPFPVIIRGSVLWPT